MKIVFSRKGFDAGAGGCASPIGPNGEMMSLPIPGGSPHDYRAIETPLGPMDAWVRDLTGGRMSGLEPAHLDPDIYPDARPRLSGWLPSLGQVDVAQSHLEGQGVGPGDVLLFFGWFRPAQQRPDGTWGFKPGAEAIHSCFGYLQIGESLRLGGRPDAKQVLAQRPWLEGHPHLTGERSANNTIHVASEELIIDGRRTGLPGGGAFPFFHPELRLTAPGASKSKWRVPAWLSPLNDGPGLSYHRDLARWTKDENGQDLLQTVAKGQEFVGDVAAIPQAGQWLEALIKTGMQPRPARVRKPGL